MGKEIHSNSTISYYQQKEKGSTERFRKAIWNLLHDKEVPLTDRQIMNILDEDDVNNIRPEITRLKQDGLIEECEKVICSFTKKKVRTTKIKGDTYKPRSFFRKERGFV